MADETDVEILALSIYHGAYYDFDNADLSDARKGAERTLLYLEANGYKLVKKDRGNSMCDCFVDWKQTVRDIFDELHFGENNIFNGQTELAHKIVAMIEQRHHDYFCSATNNPDDDKKDQG